MSTRRKTEPPDEVVALLVAAASCAAAGANSVIGLRSRPPPAARAPARPRRCGRRGALSSRPYLLGSTPQVPPAWSTQDGHHTSWDPASRDAWARGTGARATGRPRAARGPGSLQGGRRGPAGHRGAGRVSSQSYRVATGPHPVVTNPGGDFRSRPGRRPGTATGSGGSGPGGNDLAGTGGDRAARGGAGGRQGRGGAVGDGHPVVRRRATGCASSGRAAAGTVPASPLRPAPLPPMTSACR